MTEDQTKESIDQSSRRRRKVRTGVVISDKMTKTVSWRVVEVVLRAK